MSPADQATGPTSFYIAGKHDQGLAKREIRVAETGDRIAIAAYHDQVGIILLGQPGKFSHQRRLTPAGFPDDKPDLSLTVSGRIRGRRQARQLPSTRDEGHITCDEGCRRRFGFLVFLKKGRPRLNGGLGQWRLWGFCQRRPLPQRLGFAKTPGLDSLV